MVAWADYKAMARERGALALELYVVESTPKSGPEPVKNALSAHLDYQRDLESRGILVLAGPLSDATGTEMEGTGLIIFRAGSMDAARAIAEADPMHKAGARGYRLRKWLVNEGSLTVTVGLSTGKAALG